MFFRDLWIYFKNWESYKYYIFCQVVFLKILTILFKKHSWNWQLTIHTYNSVELHFIIYWVTGAGEACFGVLSMCISLFFFPLFEVLYFMVLVYHFDIYSALCWRTFHSISPLPLLCNILLFSMDPKVWRIFYINGSCLVWFLFFLF